MHWCYPNPPSGSQCKCWEAGDHHMENWKHMIISISKQTPTLHFFPATTPNIFWPDKFFTAGSVVSCQPSISSKEACAMVRLLCAAIIISKLTYFVDSQRQDFKMELAMNAVKLCKWTGISSSLPTFAHQSGTGAFNTRRTLFCWSMLKLSSSGQNTYTFFSVSTCDYDLTLNNSRLIHCTHSSIFWIHCKMASLHKNSLEITSQRISLICCVWIWPWLPSLQQSHVWSVARNECSERHQYGMFFSGIFGDTYLLPPDFLPLILMSKANQAASLLVLLSHFTPLRIYKIYITPPPQKKQQKTHKTHNPFRKSKQSKRADSSFFVASGIACFRLLHGGSTEWSTFTTADTPHNFSYDFSYV